MQIIQSRRDFLSGLSAAGAAAAFGGGTARAEEGPPETTTIRLALVPPSALRLGISPTSFCVRRGSQMFATCGRYQLATLSHAVKLTLAWTPEHGSFRFSMPASRSRH
jgi:hypothetical protein